MRRLVIVSALSLAAASAYAQSKEPIGLRDMGSFHVGGRVIEITGQPIKEVVFTPGGVPARAVWSISGLVGMPDGQRSGT